MSVVLKHLDAIDAQLELLKVQLAALRHGLTPAPKVSISLPDHCQGIAEGQCGLRTDDARIDQASLTHPNRWVCNGCRVVSTDGVTT